MDALIIIAGEMMSSFIQAISSLFKSTTVPEFHAKVPKATASEGLAQGPYVAARAGVKTMTLRTKGYDEYTGCSPSVRR